MDLNDLKKGEPVFFLRKIIEDFDINLENIFNPATQDLEQKRNDVIKKRDECIQNNLGFFTFKTLSDFLRPERLVDRYLFEIEKMKIVFLYIKIEHTYKEIVKIAYPELKSSKCLYNFENLKSFFESKNIKLTFIENFQVIDEIRLVNNEIKHSAGKIQEQKVLKIDEFSQSEEFSRNSLTLFLLNRNNLIKVFFKDLVEKIIKEEFIYTPEKLDNIIEKLRTKLTKQQMDYLKNII